MKRTGWFDAVESGLDFNHAAWGRWLVDHERVTDALRPGEVPTLPPVLETPADQNPQPRWGLWRHSRE